MKNSIVKPKKMTLNSCMPTPRRLRARLVPKSAMRVSSLPICWAIHWLSIWRLRIRSARRVMRSIQLGTSRINCCTWSMISGTIEAMKTPSRISTAKTTTMVATQRFHPWRTRKLTAGSRANDTNSAATVATSRSRSLLTAMPAT